MAVKATTSTVTIRGVQNGFYNSKTMLNNIGAIYGHGKGALTARSIDLTNIEKYSTFDPTTYKNSDGYYYCDTEDYNEEKFFREQKDQNENVIGYEATTKTASSSNPITMTQTAYAYKLQDYIKEENVYNMITNCMSNSCYWLASECTHLSDNE